MARLKFDGVIESVRYTSGGMISVVRAYERRGAVWSDHIILARTELVARLTNGKHFITGQRKEYLGSVFENGSAVHYVDKHIISGDQPASRDLLAGVALF